MRTTCNVSLMEWNKGKTEQKHRAKTTCTLSGVLAHIDFSQCGYTNVHLFCLLFVRGNLIHTAGHSAICPVLINDIQK